MYDNIPHDFAPLRIGWEEGVEAVLGDEEGAALAKRTWRGHCTYFAAEPLLTHEMLGGICRAAAIRRNRSP